MNKKDLKFEYMRGQGAGGQHKNKTSSACRITHIPTGIISYADERSQHHSKKRALAELENRLINLDNEKKAEIKKAKRDYAIHNETVIKTYDFKRQIVKDHRTKKEAPLKDILVKGNIDLLKEKYENFSHFFSLWKSIRGSSLRLSKSISRIRL